MSYLFSNNRIKIFWNLIITVKVISEGWVVYFLQLAYIVTKEKECSRTMLLSEGARKKNKLEV